MEFARKNPGDANRGKELFTDPKGMGCAKCHKINGQGGEIGPDLSTIGVQLNAEQLAESILYPSKSIREGYHQIVAGTKDGQVIAGLIRAESNESITLRDTDGKDHTISKSEIETRGNSPVSLMPENLQVGLSPQSFADLVAYLRTLQGGGKADR
jgi:quinoprotein glucose dehydrogenase